MRIIFSLIFLTLVAILAAGIYFRSISMPAADWHVDPAEISPPDSPNFELRQGDGAPVIDAALTDVADRLNAVAGAEGAQVIAGSAHEGFVSYVVRTRIMGYPDAVSVRLSPEGSGTRVEIFSRSRFGYSDMGVNAARVARWIDAVTP